MAHPMGESKTGVPSGRFLTVDLKLEFHGFQDHL